MEVVLEQADREGVWAYLESSRNVPNVAIYEKFGFKLVKEMECQEGEEESGKITLYCMMREPRGDADVEDGGESGDELAEGHMEAL